MQKIPNKFSVRVENSHMEQGKKADSISCPIALALKGHLKMPVTVGVEMITVVEDGDQNKFLYPNKVIINWIRNFDEGLVVKPISLEKVGNRLWAKLI